MAAFLLSGFTGGAALNMGDAYLMESIAVVVLGGTSVAGGQANAIGIWGGAVLPDRQRTAADPEGPARFLLNVPGAGLSNTRHSNIV